MGSGILLWTSGASGNHIGLSGVVYALAAFLFLSGVIRRHAILMRVALVVVFLYGSIVWGVFPIEVGVSWQGHLAGAFVGGLLALVWRKEGPQPPPLPPEDEELDPEDVPGLRPDGPGDGDGRFSAPENAAVHTPPGQASSEET